MDIRTNHASQIPKHGLHTPQLGMNMYIGMPFHAGCQAQLFKGPARPVASIYRALIVESIMGQ